MQVGDENAVQKNIGMTKEILEFKPILHEKDIAYFRYEKDGLKSIAFNSLVDNKPILFSKADADFIDLCNGEYKVLEIVEKTSKLNRDIPWMINLINSNNLISLLTELRVLYSEQRNPFLVSKSLKLDVDFDIVEGTYLQHEEYSKFIERAFLNSDSYHFYMNPLINGTSITEMSFIRELKSVNNRLITIKKDKKNVGMLILKVGKYHNEYILNGCIFSKDILNQLKITDLNLLLTNTNIRVKINTVTKNDDIIKIFCGDEKEEFHLRKELDNQIDVNETNIYYL